MADGAMQLPMIHDPDPTETQEWTESLEGVLLSNGRGRAEFLVGRLIEQAARAGVELPAPMNTPYVNTIPAELQPKYPGDRRIERGREVGHEITTLIVGHDDPREPRAEVGSLGDDPDAGLGAIRACDRAADVVGVDRDLRERARAQRSEKNRG